MLGDNIKQCDLLKQIPVLQNIQYINILLLWITIGNIFTQKQLFEMCKVSMIQVKVTSVQFIVFEAQKCLLLTVTQP